MNRVVHVTVDDDVAVLVVDDVVVVVAAAAVDAVVELVVMSHDVVLLSYHSLIVLGLLINVELIRFDTRIFKSL